MPKNTHREVALLRDLQEIVEVVQGERDAALCAQEQAEQKVDRARERLDALAETTRANLHKLDQAAKARLAEEQRKARQKLHRMEQEVERKEQEVIDLASRLQEVTASLSYCERKCCEVEMERDAYRHELGVATKEQLAVKARAKARAKADAAKAKADKHAALQEASLRAKARRDVALRKQAAKAEAEKLASLEELAAETARKRADEAEARKQESLRENAELDSFAQALADDLSEFTENLIAEW